MIELKPLDVIATYKEPPTGWRGFFTRLFNNKLLRYGKRLYPNGEIHCNHIRLVVGRVNGVWVGFEFTAPMAQFFKVEEWMLKPPYLKGVCRLHDYGSDPVVQKKLIERCLDFQGSIYDLGQLIGLEWPWLRWLDFGRKNMVCSSGARKIIEDVTGVKPLFGEVSLGKTPPCSFLNSNDFTVYRGEENE